MYTYDIEHRLSLKICVVTLKHNFQGQRSRSNENFLIFDAYFILGYDDVRDECDFDVYFCINILLNLPPIIKIKTVGK